MSTEKELGRIDVSKDTMLYITNKIFGEKIKFQTSKDKILEMLPQIYAKANPIDIVKMLPYNSYLTLEKIIKYVKKEQIQDGINEIEIINQYNYQDLKYLYDSMIIVMRVKKGSRKDYIDVKLLNVLEKIYIDKYREIAESYGKIEKLIVGILNTYGVIEENEYKRIINTLIGKNNKKTFLKEFEAKRLNLYSRISVQKINWDGGEKERYKTKWDLDYEEDKIIYTIKEQKSRGLDYKEYTFDEYIDNAKEKYTNVDMKFIKYLEKHRKINDYEFMKIKREIALGRKETFDLKIQYFIDYFGFRFEEMQEFSKNYIFWYNNSPQYILGGYTPNELAKKYYGK